MNFFKKCLLSFFVLFLVPPIHFVQAERLEYLYLIKDDFVSSDKILVARTASLYKDELWVIEYGVGCSGMWRFEDKLIVAKYSTFLDGVGGELILPESGSCRNWDAEELEDVDQEDLRYEDWEFLRDEDLVTGLVGSRTSPPVSAASYTCPLNSSLVSGGCVCNQGYVYSNKVTSCVDYNTSCKLANGVYSYGDVNYCYCMDGYQFNVDKTACVAKLAVVIAPPVSLSSISTESMDSHQGNDVWLSGQIARQVSVDTTLVKRLSGRMLLQVEEHGEAWYLDPVSKKRYYMKDGEIAYQMLRSFGMGITSVDLEKLQKGDKFLVDRLKGRIVLQVQAHGEAYYIHPVTGLSYYMKDGIEAYRLMRELSLGITNLDLPKIPIGEIVKK